MTGVVRLSHSGGRNFPNLLFLEARFGIVRFLTIGSCVLTAMGAAIDFVNAEQLDSYRNLSTLLLLAGMGFSLLIVRERRLATKTGVVESQLICRKSFFPLLFILPPVCLALVTLHNALK